MAGKWFKPTMLMSLMIITTGCATLSSMPVGNNNVPQPRKNVEMDRYLGKWYEIYRYDAPFQKDCEAVTGEYFRKGEGKIRVLNSCRKGAVDGKLKTATGRAKVVDPASGAKLKVSFFGPFYGDYWVLDRSDDYRWSIVGEPSGRYLWVLSRDPKPTEAAKLMLRQRVQELGYNWSLVRETQH